ncbi:MAG: Ig-like domain-containing protein [Bacteroidales bacterium]
MKRILLLLSALFFTATIFAQEGTKQLMPEKDKPLYLEFNVFDGGNFGNYSATEKERIYIYLNAGETMRFGMKMNTVNYGGTVSINTGNVKFRIKNPSGTKVFPSANEQNMPTSGTGYIATWEQAINGPTGAKLNGEAISGGYTPFTYTATTTGNHYIEFKKNTSWVDASKRFALEFFDVTITDAGGNVVTNPGDPNRSAGRLWSYGWQLCNTSFTEYPVKAHFYVFTEDEFVNKVNFEMIPFSFVFQANSFGITPNSTEDNYIARTQSRNGDQISGKEIAQYPVFLNDPDRSVWTNTLVTPPKVQVWAEEELFMDYDYNRDPLYLPLDISSVTLKKNREDCTAEDVTFFKIESSLDGYTVILIDADGDGKYSTNKSDRVIYREIKKGLNYILWDFKNDGGGVVPYGTYNASATFLGRAPSHFPLYDVETLDGIKTSAIRPFNKLNTTIYWDDRQITTWGDPYGGNAMATTQQHQLRVENHVPRLWNYRSDWANRNHNGEINTMNTWFNAIDLGYSSFDVVVEEGTLCLDGSLPWVGDVYIEGPKNADITFDTETLNYKFFSPSNAKMSAIRVNSLPSQGTLKYNGNPVSVPLEITTGNIGGLTYTPPSATYTGKTSFKWDARDQTGKYSQNTENIYVIINTPPKFETTLTDQRLCTNTTGEVAFTISDAETPAADLIVTAFSSDPTFVPNSGITLGGSGANRIATITPVANKSGMAHIYLMLDDGLTKTLAEFAVYVSPSLEFTGSTFICEGDPLNLTAVEAGATYEWKSPSDIKTTSKILNKTNPEMGTWTLTVTKTVDGITCASSREFEVEVAPNTEFYGDFDVCIGETIYLVAEEVNASLYRWSKNGTVVGTNSQTYTKENATLSDAGTYTLEVTKYGCNNTSIETLVTVKPNPSVDMSVTGSTVDPGKNGTITLGGSETGITYNVYQGSNPIPVASETGSGSTLTITVASQYLAIGNNNFTLKASNVNCEKELTHSASAVIFVKTPGITVSPTTLSTQESGAAVSFNVKLNTEPQHNVTIAVESNNTVQGTVSPESITLTSANYNTGVNITVTPGRDYEVNSGVTYTIILHPATSTDDNYGGVDPADVTVTNSNIDEAGVTVSKTVLETTEAGPGSDSFTLVLNSKPTSNVTISLSGINTNEGSASQTSVIFTPSNWNTPKLITITGKDDDIADGDITYTINLSAASGDTNYNGISIASVSVTNIDNDTAEIIASSSSITTYEDPSKPPTQFTVKLGSKPINPVTVQVVSQNTSEGTVSPSTITFTTSNWNTPQTVNVRGVNDYIADGDQNYTITLEASGSSEYNGVFKNINAVNKDFGEPGIVVSKNTVATSEPGTTDNFTVKLKSKPTENITISLVSSNINEGTASPTNLTFTSNNWNITQTVTVTGGNNNIIDGTKPYNITLTVIAGDATYLNTSLVPPVVVNGTNADDDVAGLLIDKKTLATSESGTWDEFNVKLTAQPSVNVIVTITGLVATEGSLSKTQLTFTPTNWNSNQPVRVTGVNDDIQDGNQTYTLTLTCSGDNNFKSVTESVTVTNADNDVAGISITNRTLNITEGGAAGTFTISLNTRPASGKTVTYNFTSPNANEITLSANSAVFTHDSWAPVSITVTAIDDKIDDGDQNYTIALGKPTSTDPNYTNISAGNITVNVTNINTANLIVSSVSGNTTENGGTATFTVKLATKPINPVKLTIASQNANEGKVTGGATLNFNSSNWNTAQTVTVTGQNDDIDDGNVEYTVLISVGGTDTKYTSALNRTVLLVNEDNDTAGVTITQITSPFQTTEAGGEAKFTIKLDSKPLYPVTITFSSSNPTEGLITKINGSTVTGNSNTFVFNSSNWSTAIPIIITGQDDNIDDDNQQYSINISVSSADEKYGSSNNKVLTVTNIDNDVAGVIVTKVTSPFQTTEDKGRATFTVKLATQPTNTVTLNIISNNLNEGQIVTGSTLTFTTTNWNTAQNVIIEGVNDDIADGDVDYTVSLSASSNDLKYKGIAIPNVTLKNIDNDVVGLNVSKENLITGEPNISDFFTVSLKSQPIANVTISVSSSDEQKGKVSAATKALLFTPSNWSTPQTVEVIGQNDNIINPSTSYTITLVTSSTGDTKYNSLLDHNIAAVNTDDDVAGFTITPTSGLITTEDGGTATFTVKLKSQPTHPVTIKLSSDTPTEGVVTAVSKGTVNVNLNQAYITIEPSEWNNPVTVTVTGVNDDYYDRNKSYKIITDPATSPDANYNGKNPSDISLTNNDNNTWGVIVSPTSMELLEGGAAKTFSVVLKSRPTKDVTISIASDNTSKATVDKNEVKFLTGNATDWSTPKIVTVTPVNDNFADGTTEVTIITGSIVSDDTDYNGFNPDDVTVTIIDDDEAAVLLQNLSGTATSEDGGTVTFDLKLSSKPTANVVVAISSSNTTQGTVNKSTVTFTASNWNTPQTVTVTGVNNATAGANPPYSIEFLVTSDDINYNEFPLANLALENIDNDVAGVTVSPLSAAENRLQTSEWGQNITFTVRLNTQPVSSVVINLESSNIGEGTLTESELTFTSANWNTPQSVTVKGVDDLIKDGDKDYQVNLTIEKASSSTEYKNITISPVYLVNLDDTTPRPQDDSATTIDDEQSININILSNDLGLDHGIKNVTIHTNPEKGSVTVNANNTITYVPVKIMGSANRVEDFEYSVCTNNDLCAQAKVTVTTKWKDVTPIAVDDARGTSVNEAVTIDVLFNDKNLWNGGIVVAIFEAPSKGTAIVNGDNTVTYTPAPNYIGKVTFKYKITDAQGDSNEATVTVNVREFNLLPIAMNDNAEVIKNTSKNIMVLENDVLGDGENTLLVLKQAKHGTATVNPNGYITYTPNTDYLGTDSFDYLLVDEDGDQSQASVNINVIEKPASNPIANPVSTATEMNIAVTIDVLYNDEGLEAGVKNITLASQPINGTASVNKDAVTGYYTVYYTPKTSWLGTEVFSYQILDNNDKSSNVAKITVIVKPTGTDHLPVAQDIEDSTRMNTPKELLVLDYVTGLEDGFGKLWIKGTPLLGSTSVTPNNTVIYTPYNGIIGNDSFKYVVEDVDGQFSMATVSMSILKYFDVTPVANDVETSVEYETTTNIDVLYNDTGLDNTPITLTITTAPDVTKGSATVNTADNSVHFTPANGFSGVVTFGYTITDAANKSANATVTVNVLEDGVTIIYPVAEDFEVTTRVNHAIIIEAMEHVSNLTEFGGLFIHSAPAKGTAVVNADNTITYTPANFHNGTVTFEYRVYDNFYKVWDKGTITVQIVEHFDVTPEAVNDETSVEYQTATDIDVLYNDTGLDNTPITLAITTTPSITGCTTTINADNSVRFSPATGFSGVVTFGYTITDAAGTISNEATVTVNVLKEGETIIKPIASDFEVTTRVNQAIVIKAMEHVSNLTEFGGLFIHSNPALGTAVVNSDNTITYTPSNYYEGDVTFEYRVRDGKYKVWDKGTITVHIVEYFDVTPVANDVETSVEYETPTDIDVLYNDTGLDNTPITLAITTAPINTKGMATVNTADNSVHFTPAAGFSGLVTFGYTITDDAGKTASATVTVNVLEDGVTIKYPVADDFEVTTRVNHAIIIEAMEHVSNLTEFGGLFIHSDPAFGIAVVNTDNTITYTPSSYHKGDVTFEYRVLDGKYKVWDKGTITVHVVEHFDVTPVAVDDETTVEYQTTTIIDVLYNDMGLDNTPISLTITSPPYIPGCTASVTADNEILFTPANGYSGFVSLEYTITDAAGKSSSAKVSITVLEEGETITYPVADDIDVTTRVNQSVTIAALDFVSNLTEFGGLFIHSNPALGTAVVNSDNTITYTPSNYYEGDVTFEYRVLDGKYKVWDKGTITVHVVEFFNVTPVAVNDETTVEYQTATDIDVLYNDTGLDNTPITVAITTAPNAAQGNATINANNTVHFTPATGFSGVVTFGYTITDDAGTISNEATVTVNVLKEGEIIIKPIASDFEVTTRVNQAIVIAAMDHVSNLTEFGGLFIHSAPTLGTAVVNADNTITYTPSNYYEGDVTFEYRVRDGKYKVWDTGIITVHIVEHFTEKPKANDDFIDVPYQSITDIDVLYNDENLKNIPLTISISQLPNVSGCKATINSNNTIRFESAKGYSGQVTMEYKVTDAAGKSSTATVFITVLKPGEFIVNPIANDFEVETFVNVPVIITALDHVEKLTQLGGMFIHTAPTLGNAVVNSDNTITYTPSNFYVGDVTFEYRVLDGKYNVWDTGKITVHVVPKPNSIPQAFNDAAATEFNKPRTIDVLSNDLGLDDTPITVTIREVSPNGTCVVEANNDITFTPSNNFVGITTFQYDVTDVDGDTDFATVTIDVLPDGVVNHIPIAKDDNVETYVNQTVIIDVLSNDEGLEDGFGKLEINSTPTYGKATLNTDRTISYEPSLWFKGTDTFTYRVYDIQGDNDMATVTITVIEKPNSIPVANDDSVATSINIPVNINVLHNDTGLDDVPITVRIRTNPDASEGVAVVESDNTIRFIPFTDFAGKVLFEYEVIDADGDTDFAKVSVNVKDGVNYTPRAVDDYARTFINIPIEIDVLSNDYGLNDTPITVEIYQKPLVGTAIVNADNTIKYTPAKFFKGVVTFVYKVSDVDGDFDWATVSINVTDKENSIPVANDDFAATEFETTRTIDVLKNDTGLEDEPVSIFISKLPDADKGSVVVNNIDNTIDFTPANGFSGIVLFNYTVRDADGETDEATVTVTVLEEGLKNHIPIANDDYAGVEYETPTVINVLANDTGLEDVPITVSIAIQSTSGMAAINDDNTITFTPNDGFSGKTTFGYTVTDAEGENDWATVYITVLKEGETNHIPVANDDTAGTEYETEVIVNVLANDTGLEDEPITVSIKKESESGVTTINPDNTVTFLPNNEFFGVATFTYIVTDTHGEADWAKVTITVLEEGVTNHLPIANDDFAGAEYETPTKVNVLENDTGLEDEPITISIKEQSTNGLAEVNNDDNTITFTPKLEFFGKTTFTYTVTDAQGDNDWATVTMTVLKEGGINYLPIAINDSCGTSFNESVVVNVLRNDLNLNDVPLTVTIVSGPNPKGTAIVNPDNSITFVPTTGFYGPVTFKYRVTDAQGDWDEADVKVTVKDGVNYTPKANDDFAEMKRNSSININILANDNGLNDKPIKVLISSTPEYGNIKLNEDNTLTYESEMDYVGNVTIEYWVIDVDGDWDNAMVTITIIDQIDVHPIANDDSRATSFNTPISIDVLFNDKNLDNAPIKVTLVSEPDENKGYALVDDDNKITFTPKYGFIGIVNFSYRVTDVDGDYDEADVKVTVKDADNIVPVANDDKRGTSINTAVTIPVLNNDTGLDDRPIKVALYTMPKADEGVAVVNADNTVTFIPSNGYYGIVAFKYIVTDVDGDFDTANIIVTVKNGTNTVPVAVADDALVTKNKPTIIDVLANDKGLDDTPIKLQIITEPKNKEGAATITDDNKVLFTPYEDYLGESSFSYKVSDIDGDYSTAQVSVIVVEELTAYDDYVEVDKNGSITFNVLENDIYHNVNRIEFSIASYPYFGAAVANPENTITYTPVINYVGTDSLIYKITGAHNQHAEAMVRIKIKDVGDDKLMIPEGFSPDGDGINDEFEILGLESYNNVSLMVYNRWGNMVFQSDKYQNNWDGKSNTSMSIGKTLPTGTYYYVITIKDTNKRISGNVFLKR